MGNKISLAVGQKNNSAIQISLIAENLTQRPTQVLLNLKCFSLQNKPEDKFDLSSVHVVTEMK